MREKEIDSILYNLEKIIIDGYDLGPDKRMGRASSAIRIYETYNADLGDDSADIIDKAGRVLDKFLELRDRFSEVSTQYVEINSEYVKILFEQIVGQKSSVERLEKREIKQNVKESLLELCRLIRETLEKTGLLDVLINRENNALRELGLYEFISQQEREEYKRELLSDKSVFNMTSRSDEIQLNAMCLFWINKISKIIEDCMLGYMIEKTDVSAGAGNSKKLTQVNERNKMIALLKTDLMKSLFRYCDNRFERNLDLSSDVDFESYLNSAGVCFYFPDFLRYMIYYKSDENAFPGIKQYFDEMPLLRNFYDNLPDDFKDLIDDVESRYNRVLAVENNREDPMAFVHDAFILSQMHELQKVVYDIKTQLTSVLSFILFLEKETNPSPYCKVWGISHDKELREDNDAANIFFVELPGYIQPLMVHTDSMVIETFMTENYDVPEYNGLFKVSDKNNKAKFLSTHILFRLNDRQKKMLKDTKKSWKTGCDKKKKMIAKMPEGYERTAAEKIWLRECMYYRVVEYMEAMAKDKPRKMEVEK